MDVDIANPASRFSYQSRLKAADDVIRKRRQMTDRVRAFNKEKFSKAKKAGDKARIVLDLEKAAVSTSPTGSRYCALFVQHAIIGHRYRVREATKPTYAFF